MGTGGAPANGGKGSTAKGYTAVVYVHGIGSQRRFEETSRLVDRLDKYLELHSETPGSIGELRDAEGRVERLSSKPDGPPIGFIDTKLVQGHGPPRAHVRFYEIYWAPVMAEVTSLKEVGLWVFRQVSRPWKTLSSPWRERQRLRRAALVSSLEASTSPSRQLDLCDLARIYDDFERLPCQDKYPRGSFAQFLSFIEDECQAKFEDETKKRAKKKPPETDAERATRAAGVREETSRLKGAAEGWRKFYLREELRNAFALVTLAVAIVALAGALPFATKALLEFVTSLEPVRGLLGRLEVKVAFDLKSATGIVLSILGFLGIGKVVNDYLGDVLAWATYEETDAKNRARTAVLEEAQRVLGHVLADDDCKRVVLVAHSLGTTIAHDALLAMTRCNTAKDPNDRMSAVFDLEKIEHFITLGSPIDKIEYFFESFVSRSHRYKRVVEDLRGDIGTAPFTKNGKAHIHWINFWDAGDPISGALQSPASATEFDNRVDNIQVASLNFPSPGASHSAYFDHNYVIKTLVETIYERKRSFPATMEELVSNARKEGRRQLTPAEVDQACGAVFLTEQESLASRGVFVLAAALAVWLAFAGLLIKGVAFAFGLSTRVFEVNGTAISLESVLWGVSALALLFVFIARLLLPRWHRNPIKGPPKPVQQPTPS